MIDGVTFDFFNYLWMLGSLPCAYFWMTGRDDRNSRIKATNLLFQKVETLQKANSDLHLHMAENYVRSENMQRLEQQIFIKLDRIEKKIDAKADK